MTDLSDFSVCTDDYGTTLQCLSCSWGTGDFEYGTLAEFVAAAEGHTEHLPPVELDPNWRDEYVEVEINGFRHYVHPDELRQAEQIRQYLRDAARTLREWTP